MHKNFKNIDKVCYGRGSFDQLGEIIEPHRMENDVFFLFVVDAYFKGKDLESRIPAKDGDEVIFIDVDPYEPTTDQVDDLRDRILQEKGIPSGVVGIGGGSIMDIAKAVSLMFTNEGSSTLYQGLNLIKKPGIYHVGVPTISGTGAECSMTAVLTGPEKKLGLKCDWTVFNQVVLDPDLTTSVPRNQWFYTGMDTYIHCIESETGIFYNAFSKAYGEESLKLCREVFMGENSGQNSENDEKLMIASLFGGLSLTYSEVGVCHALSYGLSKILGYKHGFANCVAFNHLKDYYGEAVDEFRSMVEHHKIDLPQDLASDWSEEQITAMAQVSYNLPHMWTHALGHDWKEKITLEDIKDLFRRM
ncbi:MAG: iron-containing alcohol dehydrogenase family protein [Bacteroidota bacterium]|nr:iron-containing alcohol dehydrogenase family protein [Bacteroidota bacterium]MDX5427291.1 iron-containing alcohol dehydrogenase family protein [Bacteroidota bacterium]MDX5447252.1 iron-containing alcohol dehydrogenase family protein [Bacteroidota bacterium]MDX5505243.1 iron-containing alcohol dehydrogenase family protein [Bacteroidota bacterium]